MLVGGAEARYPKRRRISECSTEVGGRGSVPSRSCERIDDHDGIVAEKALGQRHVIRPTAGVVTGCEEVANSRPARWHRAMRSTGWRHAVRSGVYR